MAKSVMYGNVPLDTPIAIRPGVMHREVDWHGSDAHYSLDPSDPERKKKGDIGLKRMEKFDSKPLTKPGAPWANLKKGK